MRCHAHPTNALGTKKPTRLQHVPGLLMLATLLALHGCGGRDAETATIARALAPVPATLASEGSERTSPFPPTGASLAAVDLLTHAGVASRSKRCGLRETNPPSDGDVMLSAGGTPTFVVLVEVAAADLAKAMDVGYFAVTAAYLKSTHIFGCASRSL